MEERHTDQFDFYINDQYIEATELSLTERRGLLLHLLYILEVNDYEISIEDARYYYHIDFHIIIEPSDPIIATLKEIIEKKDDLDSTISNYLHNWTMERLSLIIKLILRYAFFEFLYTEQDAKLIINEAVELARAYAEIDSYKFINGILDNYCRKNKIALKK